MIYCLIGENSFARRLELKKLIGGASARQYDGSEMAPADLATALAGQSLFGGDEIIVIDEASSNKPLWDAFGAWVEKLDDGTTLILCDTKPDKRTKTYKQLQKYGKLIACDEWSSRQTAAAEEWLRQYATKQEVKLSAALAYDMVQRAIRPSAIDEKPIIDQQLLATAVRQLRLAEGDVSQELIETVLPPSLHENVFGLLERAMKGDVTGVQRMVGHLAHSKQDGHQTFGLLASQATNIAALVLSPSTANVADDIGANPYALRQLNDLARRCSLEQIRFVVQSLAHTDEQLKSGRGDAWELVEKSLVEIALKQNPRT